MDSVAAALRVVRRTGYVVHLHHVSLINDERRWEAEGIAVQRTFEWLINAYPGRFEITDSWEDARYIGVGGYDLWPAMRRGAEIMMFGPQQWEFIFIATCTGHRWGSPWFDLRKVRRTDGNPAWPWHIRNAYYRQFDINSGHSLHRKPLIFPVSRRSRDAIAKWLPDELFRLTWSCRTPIETTTAWTPCGECRTCTEWRAAGLAHHELRK